MRTYKARCAHCQTEFYYPSGSHTDSTYCADCFAVMMAALKDAPKRFEKLWHVVDDPDLKQRVFEARNTSSLIQRVGSPLYRMDGGKVVETQVVFFSYLQGRTYQVSYWPSQPTELTVHEECAKDLQTQKLYPW